MKNLAAISFLLLTTATAHAQQSPASAASGDISGFVAGAPAATTLVAKGTTEKKASAVDTQTPVQMSNDAALPDEILAADNNARITKHGDGYAYSFDHVPMPIVCACLTEAFHWTVVYTGSSTATFTGSGEVTDPKMIPLLIVNGTSLVMTGHDSVLEIRPNQSQAITITSAADLSAEGLR